MKPRFAFSSLFFAVTSLIPAQEEAREVESQVDTEAAETVTLRAPAELEQMLAPIALYPDPLIALMLPASTMASDVVLAARYVSANPTATSFDQQSWDDSVKGLAHYPEVLKWMDQNLEWTKQVGEAFAQQPADVMSAVQSLRSKARSAGSLATTPQQTVVTQGENIQIVPTSTEVIYVPSYDPAVVYVESPYYYYPRPALTFGLGFAIGSWMSYDCDWGRRSVCYVRPAYRTSVWRDHCAVGYVANASRPHRYSQPYWRAWRPSASVQLSARWSAERRSSSGYSGRRDFTNSTVSQANTHQVTAPQPGRESDRRNTWVQGGSRQSSSPVTAPSNAYVGSNSGRSSGRHYSDRSSSSTRTVAPSQPSAPVANTVTTTRPAVVDSNSGGRFTAPTSDRARNYVPRQHGDNPGHTNNAGYANHSRESRPAVGSAHAPASPSRSYSPPRAQPPAQVSQAQTSSSSQQSSTSQSNSRAASWQAKMAESNRGRSDSGRR